MDAKSKRIRVDIRGVVQGVGFRPFLHELATKLHLTGKTFNTSDGVTAEVQGDDDSVREFLARIETQAPPLAFVIEVVSRPLPAQPSDFTFEIQHSQRQAQRTALLPPDVCICKDCLEELLNPSDRRFGYPFINCTNCGPRYTIIDDIPYDRSRTSMAKFSMCEACRREYEDPRNRRFHAQPNACFDCGPKAWLTDRHGEAIETADPIHEAGRLLSQGKVVAIKGLGGFHLAVDASNSRAVLRLRERKHREAKPFAVMCRTIEEARRHVIVSDDASKLLESRHRPIVLLPKSSSTALADEVAPANPDLGVMLPYTPLHVLLLEYSPPSLVMTSGNMAEEPIVMGNDEAIERLGNTADAFLLHDRDILVRNDDSVVRTSENKVQFLRRSRGYAPLPIILKDEGPCVLGVGGELKNTICLTKGRMAFLSQHVGDLANVLAVDAFVDAIERLQRVVDVHPLCIGVDQHPDYASSRWTESRGLPIEVVQHHHAHLAACLAEHQEQGPVLGLALDGTGLGTDGAIWGGELLIADLLTFQRLGHLAYVPMPGGDQAARQPWRMAVSYLVHAFEDKWSQHCPDALRKIPRERIEAIAQISKTGTLTPMTSSTGRLFDGVAALCGLTLESRFEAEAAMRLEMTARQALQDPTTWPVEFNEIDGVLQLEPSLLIRSIVEELAQGTPVDRVAMRFHRSLAKAWVDACVRCAEKTGLTTVVLSGGSIQNTILSKLLSKGLSEHGLRVLLPIQTPPNDGGIALGQAIVARCRLQRQ